MGLELFNEPTSISRRFSREFIGKALELARLYGWRPLGTQPPVGLNLHLLNAEWDGAYLTNDGQVVLAEDARSLACALERSLDDIPDDVATMDWNPKCWTEDELPEWLSPEEKKLIEEGLEEYAIGVDAHPFEFFAGEEKRHLMRFMRFCKLGSFTIL